MLFGKGTKAKLGGGLISCNFDCHCTYPSCRKTLISPELIERLLLLYTCYLASRDDKILLSSAYRCAQHNIDVGGAPKSLHMNGEAADLVCLDIAFLHSLGRRIFQRSFEYEKHVHVDLQKYTALR